MRIGIPPMSLREDFNKSFQELVGKSNRQIAAITKVQIKDHPMRVAKPRERSPSPRVIPQSTKRSKIPPASPLQAQAGRRWWRMAPTSHQ
ncbi:hypothetical protein FGO68_gene17067 [Halteria grandinella]|uniref:Uncharacterized protein n=1 Tax=Halteria grandinella TaxID=5974 RepID=A0A8J8NBQ6_HALGN|nr:hypothetical protein FGO68_gene17067 [Halteria grandinella]